MYYLNWRLLPFFDAIDRTTAYQGTYQPSLVFLSLSIAILAAYVALSIANRIRDARTSRARFAWTTAGAISMGGGIWAMHFIGMLAFTLPCGVDYNPFGTLLSMIPGGIASGIALTVISKRGIPTIKNLLGGAVLMGGGIGAMHYAGMAAMRPQALLLYDPFLVGVSVVVAVVLAFVSLGIRFRFPVGQSEGFRATLVAAVVMGCAVSGMHYTAMQAAVFFPQLDPSILNLTLPKATLAIGIAIVTCLVATSALVSTFAGQQTELAQTLRAEVERRQEIERDAENERARVQAILDGVVDGVVTINKEGRILQWSTGAERLFGYTVEEAVGADITMLMPEPERSIGDRHANPFLTTGNAKVIGTGRQLSAIRKDGTEFPMELAVNEVRANGEILFTGILRDITERKRAETALIQAREQAESASVAKSKFLATMSHEIRTPMNGILGMANLLASGNLSEHQRRLVTSLTGSGQALLAIINDILDFSKIEAGRFELFESDFDPRDVLAEVAAVFCERCAAKNLELVYFIAEDVPSQLRGDPVRLRQVIINLVGNAVRFTHEGEVVVEVGVEAKGEHHVRLRFGVRDTGPGIPPEKRQVIFQAFSQADSSFTRRYGGTGLGLTIASQLVGLMGGRLELESEVGKGSLFHFSLPFALAEEAAAPPAADRARLDGLPVLAVDDNETSRRILAEMLRGWGMKPRTAVSGPEALAAMKSAAAAGRPFRLVLLDVMMPGMDGFAVVEEMARCGELGAPAVIILSSAHKEETARRAEAPNVGAFLLKPIRQSELLQSIFQVLGVGAEEQLPAAEPPRAPASLKVLVAEDNAINQRLALRLLERRGHQAEIVDDGAKAVEAVARKGFDIVLMDVQMPGMDGFQATAAIREREELIGGHIPIIAMTAHAMSGDRERCLAAGMDGYVSKPLRAEDFYAVVETRGKARPRTNGEDGKE